jgi:hypothetical protein
MWNPLSVVLTYREPVPEIGDEIDLRRAFAANWRSRGWTPVELDRSFADRHPLGPRLRQFVSCLPTTNWPTYEIASWMRYAAFAQWFTENPNEAAALCADDDIFNRKFTVADALEPFAANGLVVITGHNPVCYGALLGNRHALSLLPQMILDVAPLLTYDPGDGRLHCSDYLFHGFLLDWARIASRLIAQQLFSTSLLANDPPAMAMRVSAAPLIHVSNAACTFHATSPVPRALAFQALSSFFP